MRQTRDTSQLNGLFIVASSLSTALLTGYPDNSNNAAAPSAPTLSVLTLSAELLNPSFDPNTTEANDRFGTSVALSGHTLAGTSVIKFLPHFPIPFACLQYLTGIAILRTLLTRREGMGDYQIGGGLQLLTAVQKTEAFAEFLNTRMKHALETEDPTELHYLLAQVDDYHSYLWRYYKKLSQVRSQRMDPGV